MATRYGAETRMKAGDVLKQAVHYFGPDGLGLQVSNRTLTSVRLEGGGGYVEVQVRAGPQTEVDMVLHQWEAHASTFLQKIQKQGGLLRHQVRCTWTVPGKWKGVAHEGLE